MALGVLRTLRDAAAVDSEREAVSVAIDCFAATKQPQRTPSGWFFASGSSTLVVRYDGQVYACTADGVRRLDLSGSPATYAVDGVGSIVRATIDGEVFNSLRPPDRALQLLNSVHAVLVENTPVAADPVLAPPDEHTATPNEALRVIQGLLADGLISVDEYDQKRRQILDRI